MGRMTFRECALSGLFEVTAEAAADARGSFVRTYCEEEFAPIRRGLHWTQVNLSRTSGAGTVRGMHFQRPPHAEAKLIRCIRGKVFDVAVDVRTDSPTYLQWHAVELTEDNDRMFFIPEGFAHGFQTLSDEAHLLYMHTSSWTPGFEGQLRFDDPTVAIAWPRPVGLVSPRDLTAPLAGYDFTGVNA
jgi:dTDP-4-dehydrorhamnose 3,5-epimerase